MKQKGLLVILLMLWFSSCMESSKNDFYYPNSEAFTRSSDTTLVRLSSFSSFKEFKSEMWKLRSKNFVILLENEQNRFFVKYSDREDCIPPIVKLKNLIGISKDSVYKWEKMYSIDHLESILKTDLLNKGADNQFADHPKSLIIQFLDPYHESMQDLEETLLHLITVYNRIALETTEELQLNIHFEEMVKIKPLPKK